MNHVKDWCPSPFWSSRITHVTWDSLWASPSRSPFFPIFAPKTLWISSIWISRKISFSGPSSPTGAVHLSKFAGFYEGDSYTTPTTAISSNIASNWQGKNEEIKTDCSSVGKLWFYELDCSSTVRIKILWWSHWASTLSLRWIWPILECNLKTGDSQKWPLKRWPVFCGNVEWADLKQNNQSPTHIES